MIENKKKPNLKLKLIKKGRIHGYKMNDVMKVLGEKEFAKFKQWIWGQTVAVYKNDMIVYQGDFERYLLGLPIQD